MMGQCAYSGDIEDCIQCFEDAGDDNAEDAAVREQAYYECYTTFMDSVKFHLGFLFIAFKPFYSPTQDMQDACQDQLDAYSASFNQEDASEDTNLGVEVMRCANDFISKDFVGDCAADVGNEADEVESFQTINQCLKDK